MKDRGWQGGEGQRRELKAARCEQIQSKSGRE